MSNEDETVTVTLLKAVTHGEGDNATTYDKLTFREATVGDMIVADSISGEFGKMAAAFAAIADIPFPAFKKVKARDFKRIVAAAGHLVGNDIAPAETGAE